ncbi:MAG: hypothetical protein M1829_005230 [Trizodia sp. TS-e1964]|nr:MAG: hypothetical protein M1829_005230 [Trizodia sp. TS-e1964]
MIWEDCLDEVDKDAQLLEKLFDRRKAAISLAIGLSQFYNGIDDERKLRCKKVIKFMTSRIKTDTYPVQEISEYLQQNRTLLDIANQIADSIHTRWPFGSNKLEKTVEMAQKLISDMNFNLGLVEKTQQSTAPELVPTKEISYVDAAQRYLAAMDQIRKAISSSRYDEARSLIDAALEAEVQFGLNDPGRRSTLLFFSSVVSSQLARPTDALRDIDEAIRLSGTTADSPFAPMKTLMAAVRKGLVLQVKLAGRLGDEKALVPCSGCQMAKGTRSCLRCCRVMYCNSACQKRHWKESHKKDCEAWYRLRKS